MLKNETDHALPLLPAWYAVHARALPWRADREPYHVWVSEIMLQQTRVEAVKRYYLRFLEALPTVEALAACGEEHLLKLWEGLGYYSRARNLHRAAQTIVSEYGGIFPDEYEKILSLSGIGPYTAGAVSSISFRRPEPAVDGNVLRIFSRLCNDDRDIRDAAVKKELEAVLRAWLSAHPEEDPGILNQALMELGAIVCVPNGAPHCTNCPWEAFCAARCSGTIAQRPVRSAAAARRRQERTILLITDGERILLHRRGSRGLLAGMTEPVNLEGQADPESLPALVRSYGLDPVRVTKAPQAKHVFTHIEWEMQGYLIRISGTEGFRETQTDFFAARRQLETAYPVPSAFRPYFEWLRDRGIF